MSTATVRSGEGLGRIRAHGVQRSTARNVAACRDGQENIVSPDLKKQGESDDGSGGQKAPWSGPGTLGIEFIVVVGLFLLLGWWLDSRFESRPWLTLVGLAIGFSAGMYRMVTVLRRGQNKGR